MADLLAVTTNPGGGTPFELTITFEPPEVVVNVCGEIDPLTAPALGGLVGALVDGGHLDIVLDLAELDFMDASGLNIVAEATSRLQSAGGSLTIRSPSAMVRRMLDITEMSELIEVGPLAPEVVLLGPEQHAGDESSHVASASPGSVTSDLARVAALPAGNDVIDAALRLVTALARATVGGAEGVSVSLTRHGRLTTVAASDETIAQMDRDQYTTGEGPCLSAASEGHWFHVESLAEEGRWPQFIPRAIDGGIASILSTPLMVSARPVGALNIYAGTERAFGPRDQELAALFATQASAILADARLDIATETVAKRLRDALEVRELIAQAQGVVMARQGVSAGVAYGALRRSAKRTGVPVKDRAAAIVAATPRDGLIGEVGT